MQPQICLVTGANAGIGKAVALELAKQGTTVLMVARNQERGIQAQQEIIAQSGNSSVHLLLADLSSQQSIRHLVGEVKRRFPRLDVLINNAGVHTARRSTTVDGLETMFATNHLGYFMLTNLLLDHLKAPARILNLSAPSTVRLNFDDLQGEKKFNSLVAFGASKMANLLFTFALARRLEGSGVTVNAVHPGLVRSNIMKEANVALRVITRLISKPPDHAGKQIARLALDPAFEGCTGRFYLDGKEISYATYADDQNIQQQLWQISEQLTNQKEQNQ